MIVKKRFLYGLPLIIVFCSFFFFSSVAHLGEQLASCCLYPFLVTQRSIVVPLQHWWQKKPDHALIVQLAQLKQERDSLLAESVALRATLNYSEHVHELFNFQQRYALENAVITQILLKHFSATEHYFLVDKGSIAGIVPDMVAVVHNNLVGRVAAVYPFYSKIVLVTDTSCKVAAYCSNTKSLGIYEGTNKQHEGVLSHVSHLQTMQEGDLILSSGDGLIFPQGFALGTVKKATVNDIYYQVEVTPLIDVAQLSYCFLLQKGAEQKKLCLFENDDHTLIKPV